MKTILGYFDNRDQALNAINRLVSNGLINDGEADLVDQTYLSGSTTGTGQSTQASSTREGSFGSRISHFFSDIFGNDESYHPYAEGIRRGDVLVRVNTDDSRDADKIADTLQSMGAADIDRRAEYFKSSGFSRFDATSAQPYSLDETNQYRSDYREWETKNLQTTDQEQTLPVIEEQLKVGKREIKKGGIRVFTRVTERPVEEEISLRDEEIEVERRPADRVLGAGDMASFKESEIEFSETDEEAVVSKEARVVEEVGVKKTARQRKETVRDKVRRQDVEVERTDEERADTDRPLNPER